MHLANGRLFLIEAKRMSGKAPNLSHHIMSSMSIHLLGVGIRKK
jgi:hypothetical protein